MKRGKSSVPGEVKQLASTVRRSLAAHNLVQPVRCDYRHSDPCWKVSARKIPAPFGSSVPGKWRLNMGWTLAAIPPGGELVVLESSIGLYGAQVPALGGGDEEVCLIRYDNDLRDAGPEIEPLGAHVNVFQPEPLKDRIHYRVPNLGDGEWPLREVLAFLVSERLRQDLEARLN